MPIGPLRDVRRDAYLSLILGFPLKPIRSGEQLTRAHEVINSIMSRGRLSAGERDYLQVLSKLAEDYEEERYPMADVSGGDMLRHLVEARGLTQSRVAKETHIAESTVSAVLAGKRDLTLTHARKLAAYFKVDPGVFL